MVLVWFIMIEQLSPGLSAFYAVAILILILLTQRPIKALFRGLHSGEISAQARVGFDELVQGLIGGARNMIGIACAVAAAGIVVGTVTLTGLGQVMGEVVETLSGRQHLPDPGLHRADQPDPRHGPAHHGELHRRRHADGADHRRTRPGQRDPDPADRRASLRLLFRNHGGCDAPCGARLLCRSGGVARRPR